MQLTRSRLAVLIDGDNVAARHADTIFDSIDRLGEAPVRRIYGHLAEGAQKGWQQAIARHALLCRQHYPLSKGKNAADIALVIDAMDLLHSGDVQGFCIVSSDCDFTRLAIRLREAGKAVYGFGSANAVASYRASCRAFHTLADPQEDADIVKRIAAALKQCSAVDGWVNLGQLGTQLASLKPPVKCKDHGAASLAKLLEKTGAFELRMSAEGGIRARRKA